MLMLTRRTNACTNTLVFCPACPRDPVPKVHFTYSGGDLENSRTPRACCTTGTPTKHNGLEMPTDLAAMASFESGRLHRRRTPARRRAPPPPPRRRERITSSPWTPTAMTPTTAAPTTMAPTKINGSDDGSGDGDGCGDAEINWGPVRRKRTGAMATAMEMKMMSRRCS